MGDDRGGARLRNSAIILDNVGFKILETFSKNYAWAACLPCKYHNIPTLGCGYTFYKQTSALSAQSQLSLAMHVNVKQDMECWCIMLKEQECTKKVVKKIKWPPRIVHCIQIEYKYKLAKNQGVFIVPRGNLTFAFWLMTHKYPISCCICRH